MYITRYVDMMSSPNILYLYIHIYCKQFLMVQMSMLYAVRCTPYAVCCMQFAGSFSVTSDTVLEHEEPEF